jgi:hypothetical protein
MSRIAIALLLVGALGCGRLGFNTGSGDLDASSGDDSGDGDGSIIDAGPAPDAGWKFTATDYSKEESCEALWNFDEPTPLANECGAQDLLAFNTPTFGTTAAPHAQGTALVQTDGATVSSADYVALYLTDAPHAPLDETHSDFTLGCWIRASNTDEFVNLLRNRTGTLGFWLVLSGQKFSVRLDADAYLGEPTVLPDTWYHVVVRYNDRTPGASIDPNTQDNEVAIFINGKKDCAGGTCSTKEAALSNNANPFTIGGLLFNNLIYDPPTGVMDECFVISDSFANNGGALAEEQICEICRCGFTGKVPDRGSLCQNCVLPGGSQCGPPL